jgi:hypothetical protein
MLQFSREKLGSPRQIVQSKAGFLAGLPRHVVQRIEAACDVISGGRFHCDRCFGVRLDRERCPQGLRGLGHLGDSRKGKFPEWAYRLLEASFCVENELEHEGRNQRWVDELRYRRNCWLDELGENEVRP